MRKITLYVSGSTGNPKNTVYPTAVRISDAEDLQDAVLYDHVCARYKDNRRSESNFQESDCIAMDCDNDHSEDPTDWKTLADVAAAFPGAAFLVAYSRNHMKEKNGKAPRPKFHVYFPIGPVTDSKQYAAMKQQLLQRFPWFDSNAADAARFYFGTSSPQTELYDGDKTVDMLLPKVIPVGSRNATMSKAAGRLIKRYGDTVEAYDHFLIEAQKCVPPLDQQEMDSIWSSARKFGKRVCNGAGYVPPEQFNPPAAVSDFLNEARPEQNRLYPWTDIGAGQLFADCFKSIIRYVPERKCWYKYENGVWSEDVGNLRAMELCKQLANALILYALTIEDER